MSKLEEGKGSNKVAFHKHGWKPLPPKVTLDSSPAIDGLAFHEEWWHRTKNKSKGCSYCSKYCLFKAANMLWYLVAFANHCLGLGFIPAGVVITVLLDVLTLRFRSISKLLDIPWLLVCYVQGELWVDQLEIFYRKNYFLLKWWMEYTPQFHYSANKAIFVYARLGLADKVEELAAKYDKRRERRVGVQQDLTKTEQEEDLTRSDLTQTEVGGSVGDLPAIRRLRRGGIQGPTKEEDDKRDYSLQMVIEFQGIRTDKQGLKLLKKYSEKKNEEDPQKRFEIDLNWQGPVGNTVLSVAMRKGFKDCVKWLLEEGADPNIQDHYHGDTGMHRLVQKISKRGRKNVHDLMEILVNHKDVDFTILNYNDRYHGVKQEGGGGLLSCCLKTICFCFYLPYALIKYSMWPFYELRDLLSNKEEMGKTPYMLLDGNKYDEIAAILRPTPSFNELSAIIQDQGKSETEKCAAIYELIAEHHGEYDEENKAASLHHLRIMDMLYCENECGEKWLKDRRQIVFDHFLKEMVLYSTKKALTKPETALLRWVFYQSAGPPGTTLEDARGCSKETLIKWAEEEKMGPKTLEKIRKGENLFGYWFQKEFGESQKSIESRYGKVYESLKKMQGEEGINSQKLFKIPDLQNFVEEKELCLSTFSHLPDFIRNQNGIQAVRDLYSVGAIKDTGEFCDLLQGRHRLFQEKILIGLFLGDPNITSKTFCNPGDGTLWTSLLLIWQICLQEKIHLKDKDGVPVHDEFEKAMKGIERTVNKSIPKGKKDEGVELKVAPVKGFIRSLEKADEYAVKRDAGVLGATYVIDGLRCSFIVNTVAQNLEVGKLLEQKFGVARTKNSHQNGHMSYADRKYNVVYESGLRGVDGSPVNVICEIQILMKEYNDIKSNGHLLYEFQRDPEQKSPLNLRSRSREIRNKYVGYCKLYFLYAVALSVFLMLDGSYCKSEVKANCTCECNCYVRWKLKGTCDEVNYTNSAEIVVQVSDGVTTTRGYNDQMSCAFLERKKKYDPNAGQCAAATYTDNMWWFSNTNPATTAYPTVSPTVSSNPTISLGPSAAPTLFQEVGGI